MRRTIVVRTDSSPISDLKRPWSNRVRTDRHVTGHIELAYMRGFQGGYLQAMKDAKSKQMKKSHALQPSRSE